MPNRGWLEGEGILPGRKLNTGTRRAYRHEDASAEACAPHVFEHLSFSLGNRSSTTYPSASSNSATFSLRSPSSVTRIIPRRRPLRRGWLHPIWQSSDACTDPVLPRCPVARTTAVLSWSRGKHSPLGRHGTQDDQKTLLSPPLSTFHVEVQFAAVHGHSSNSSSCDWLI